MYHESASHVNHTYHVCQILVYSLVYSIFDDRQVPTEKIGCVRVKVYSFKAATLDGAWPPRVLSMCVVGVT